MRFLLTGTAYKCRACPDQAQAHVLNRTFGCVRVAWKAISDCGRGAFRAMLEFKAARYGRRVIVIGRWYPSSKRCSACGHLLAELSLACGADVRHSGSSRVRSAVKQNPSP
jgi:Putative transposase DNA-binding domain/Helix-turn-helix domain